MRGPQGKPSKGLEPFEGYNQEDIAKKEGSKRPPKTVLLPFPCYVRIGGDGTSEGFEIFATCDLMLSPGETSRTGRESMTTLTTGETLKGFRTL